MIYKPNKPPESVSGFRPGDRVITPLGRRATIARIRIDGFLDAVYDDGPPSRAEVVLQPSTLRRRP